MFLETIKSDSLISQSHAHKALQLLLEGGELTFRFEERKAIINMFKENEFEMNYDVAKCYVELGLLACTGGNFELKERHYLLTPSPINLF
ncbi:hypothetical protein [Sphingobacterium sp.]|uniref:hypothetical protein n=1 Tax=Sphingobacterium sp. TaxID=341027 RepID=UPI0028A6D5F6|nr:hypothetical protein [Sphingobacterium sp.]